MMPPVEGELLADKVSDKLRCCCCCSDEAIAMKDPDIDTGVVGRLTPPNRPRSNRLEVGGGGPRLMVADGLSKRGIAPLLLVVVGPFSL